MRRDSLTLLTSPSDIDSYVLSLWTKDGPFYKSHKDGGLIGKIVSRFAGVPRIFFDSSEKETEWTHFSTWWGAILRVDYDNPIIRDLRYLHEIYHAATMPYVTGMDFDLMKHRNFENERISSAFTEMAIYLEFPELREMTFDHPIFVDRFVFPQGGANPEQRWIDAWRENPERTLHELMVLRMREQAMAKDDNDPQVIWLVRYREQNERWANIWRKNHTLVDDAMVRLDHRARIDFKDAAEEHLDWLWSVSENDIPFYDEARLFRRAFDDLITEYTDAMDRAKAKPLVGYA